MRFASIGVVLKLSTGAALAQPMGGQQAPTDVQPAQPVQPTPQGSGYPYSTGQAPYWYTATEEEREERWYGWQTLVVDGAVILATVAAAAADQQGESAGVVFVAGYALGAPIVHTAHGQVWWEGVTSLGIRVGAPVTGALLGPGISNCSGDFCEVGAAAAGLLLGMVTAVVIDAAVLAYEPVEAGDEASSGSSPDQDVQLSASPLALPSASGGSVIGGALTGQF